MVYTLIFIQKDNKILLLNRNKNPWKGCWNGVGGKLEENETIYESILREVYEETTLSLSIHDITYKGIMTWNTNSDDSMHLFIGRTTKALITPLVMREGILDWKEISWASDPNNLGVAYNIPYFLMDLFLDKKYHYHCIFEGNQVKEIVKEDLK